MAESNVARVVGRYTMLGEIGAGGMATVHLGVLSSAGGFQKAVAIKRLHANLARDAELTSVLFEEARLAARVVHAHVVQMLDAVDHGGEAFLVMEYVHGETLHRLLASARTRAERVNPAIAVSVVSGMLRGLHAAHEARGEGGASLGLVHRDVSPQNVIVGVDGLARVLDFGIAKAQGRASTTREGRVKGKLAYMAPEQLHGDPLTRRTDVWGAGVVLWEMLTGERLFTGDSEAEIEAKIRNRDVPVPTELVPDLAVAFNRVVLRALASEPESRFSSALAMAEMLEGCTPGASASAVGAWVTASAAEDLARREGLLRELESVGRAKREPGRTKRWRFRTAVLAGVGAGVGALGVVAAAYAIRWTGGENTGRSAGMVEPPAVASVASAPPAPDTVRFASDEAGSPAAPRDAGPARTKAVRAAPGPTVLAAPAASGVRTAPRDCDPPYMADDAGRIQFKRECLP